MKLSTFNRCKRFFDLTAVLLSAPVSAPVGLLTGLLVKRFLGSPVFFSQPRVGLDEVEFEVLKFRTMTDDRDADGVLLPDANRLTKFGRFLRATSLDEIPQLLNVARGDMSLVGPRPLFVRYLPHYTPMERERHRVRPGITGLAQTSGRNGVEWDTRLARDVEYVRSASLLLDIKILAATVWQVLRSEGVSVLASDSGEPLDIARSYPSDDRMTLRRLRSSDLSRRVDWIADPRIHEHMQWGDVTVDSTQKWFAVARRDRERLDYAAEVDGEVVAMAGLRKTSPVSAEFYVMVDPGLQGQGWGSRVTKLVLQHGWKVLRLDEITLTVAKDNQAARRIYEALGFELVSSSDQRLWMRCSQP